MPGSALVLMYHRVVPTGAPVGDIDVPRDVFAEQLTWMRAAGDEFVDAETFMALRTRRDGKHRVLVTFDDGNRSIHDQAWPVLRDLDIPHTQFVITGTADAELADFLSWRQMEAMAAAPGTRFASHSHRHEEFAGGRADREGLLRHWREDLARSRASLARLGSACLPGLLAWPWGYTNRALLDMAESLGFTAQYMAYPGRADCVDDARVLPRIALDGPNCRQYREKLAFWRGPLAPAATRARRAYVAWRIRRALGCVAPLVGAGLLALGQD